MDHLSVQYLDQFIEVYGNRHRHIHLIAMRFKQPIIVYKSNSPRFIPITFSHNCISVIRGKCPPLPNIKDLNILLFTEDNLEESIQISNDRPETLLRSLFQKYCNILLSHFNYDVLFLVAANNPFSSIMKKCPKGALFKTFSAFIEARQSNRALTLEEVSMLRFFKRYEGNLKQFSRWSSFAFHICKEACYFTTGRYPSGSLGKEVFAILKRSQLPPEPLPPPDFYLCEILFTNTEPVGIAFLTSEQNERKVEYVSPMVVTRPKYTFRDTGNVVCNAWLPLYQNPDMWRNFGLKQYVKDLVHNKVTLKLILTWLQIQTSEKHKLLYMDLIQVAKIICGKNYLKPI